MGLALFSFDETLKRLAAKNSVGIFERRSLEKREEAGVPRRSRNEPFMHGKQSLLRLLIRVRVTPNSKEPLVVKVGEADFEVRVDEKAVDGRANKRLLAMLAEHFGVPKSRISVVKGARSRDKILEVMS